MKDLNGIVCVDIFMGPSMQNNNNTAQYNFALAVLFGLGPIQLMTYNQYY